MNKKLFFTLSFILLLPVLVSAQGWNELLHVPSDYSTMPNLLYFVILPFLGTFAIIWGILTNLNIFKNYRVNVLLSLIFAFSLMYYGVLLAITHYLFTIGGIVGVVAFFVLFFVLSSLYTAKRIGEDYGEFKKIQEKYKKNFDNTEHIGKEIEKNKKKKLNEIEKAIKRARRELNKLEKQEDKIEKEIDDLTERIELMTQKILESHDQKRKEDIAKNERQPLINKRIRLESKLNEIKMKKHRIENYLNDLISVQSRI